ncbi:hypothetical protein NECID01_0099 [Nematocida sp. AWRm77]|nr:hypothetical protein NECID01_0099 [Nematocida sp. AWRm77]
MFLRKHKVFVGALIAANLKAAFGLTLAELETIPNAGLDPNCVPSACSTGGVAGMAGMAAGIAGLAGMAGMAGLGGACGGCGAGGMAGGAGVGGGQIPPAMNNGLLGVADCLPDPVCKENEQNSEQLAQVVLSLRELIKQQKSTMCLPELPPQMMASSGTECLDTWVKTLNPFSVLNASVSDLKNREDAAGKQGAASFNACEEFNTGLRKLLDLHLTGAYGGMAQHMNTQASLAPQCNCQGNNMFGGMGGLSLGGGSQAFPGTNPLMGGMGSSSNCLGGMGGIGGMTGGMAGASLGGAGCGDASNLLGMLGGSACGQNGSSMLGFGQGSQMGGACLPGAMGGMLGAGVQGRGNINFLDGMSPGTGCTGGDMSGQNGLGIFDSFINTCTSSTGRNQVGPLNPILASLYKLVLLTSRGNQGSFSTNGCGSPEALKKRCLPSSCKALLGMGGSESTNPLTGGSSACADGQGASAGLFPFLRGGAGASACMCGSPCGGFSQSSLAEQMGLLGNAQLGY